MRTKMINLYSFDELSDDAKENALEHFRTSGDDLYGWHDENQASLNAFAKALGIAKRDIDWAVQMSGYGPSYAIVKNVPDLDYWMDEDDPYTIRDFIVDHFDLSADCPFTGYCMDEDLIDPFRQYMGLEVPARNRKSDIDENSTLEQLINAALDNWVRAYIADWDYQYSDEGLKETIECNDWEFLEDGSLA